MGPECKRPKVKPYPLIWANTAGKVKKGFKKVPYTELSFSFYHPYSFFFACFTTNDMLFIRNTPTFNLNLGITPTTPQHLPAPPWIVWMGQMQSIKKPYGLIKYNFIT